jgi:hypothetical protein
MFDEERLDGAVGGCVSILLLTDKYVPGITSLGARHLTRLCPTTAKLSLPYLLSLTPLHNIFDLLIKK